MNFLDKKAILITLAVTLLAGCSLKDIPTEFPTPPPNPPATPLAKIALKRDLELETLVSKIAQAAKGKVGVAAVLLETGDAAILSGDDRFPMQSVYKLPISMAVMDQVRRGELDLDEKIGVNNEDMVRAGMRSPLRDDNPNGGEFSIRELIRLAIVESDGTASDVLMRVSGVTEIQSFLTQIGIRDIKVANTEKQLGGDWNLQYDNYSTPIAAAELLRWLATVPEAPASVGDPSSKAEPTGSPGGRNFSSPGAEPPVNAGNSGLSAGDNEIAAILLKFMADSVPGAKRLKGDLPPGTYIAHKTGTSGTQNDITAATNDIGIIRLPSGKHFAIAIFVSDSPADEKTREAVIAKIAKAVWDRWNK